VGNFEVGLPAGHCGKLPQGVRIGELVAYGCRPKNPLAGLVSAGSKRFEL